MSFATIGLHCPQKKDNIGGVLRAAHCYGAKQVVIGGHHNAYSRWVRHASNTTRADRHIPVVLTEDVLGCRPFGSEVVAVEIVDDANDLRGFTHPKRAVYVFGPENGTLGAKILDRAQHVVSIPTAFCMNLAATVNVVLYDRLVKMGAA